jgi:hypothetical protein
MSGIALQSKTPVTSVNRRCHYRLAAASFDPLSID